MSYYYDFKGRIPRSDISDLAGLKSALARMSNTHFPNQHQTNTYDVESWLGKTGIVIKEHTNDWGKWVERTLLAIAPFVKGKHTISVKDEEGHKHVLTIHDGTVFELWPDQAVEKEIQMG